MIRRAKSHEVIDVRWTVLRVGRPRESAVFSHDDSGFHWVDEQDGHVIGVASVLSSPWAAEPISPLPGLQLRGMAVLPALHRTGRGAALLARVQQDLSVPLWCNARTAVVGFYARGGWISHGEVFEIPGVGPHQRMYWNPS